MDILVNAAISVDGKLSNADREQVAISGSSDFDRVDQIRAERDAIMVGVGTVIADDPHLDLDDPALQQQRKQRGEQPNPIRVVADSDGRTPLDARVLDDVAETYILTAETINPKRKRQLEKAGATVVVAGDNKVNLPAAIDELEDHGIESMLIEGGGELLYSVFAHGLVDKLSVYIGSMIIGGRDAPTLVDGEGFDENFPKLSLETVTQIDDGVLLEYTLER